MPKGIKNIDLRESIIKYINDNDIFWMEDLRYYLFGTKEYTRDVILDISIISTVISNLLKKNILQCCSTKGNSRQYIRIPTSVTYKDTLKK